MAWHDLGWEAVAYAEFDNFPSAVLAHHYPEIINLGDVTKITDDVLRELGHIDLIVGGSPCQDLSVAGKRAGLDGERSGLFHEQMRIFNAARSICGTRFMLWENVPGAYSSNSGRDFATVAGEMAGCKLSVPIDGWGNTGIALGENGLCEWACLDAQYFGLAQRRKRVFALIDTGDWQSRSPVLFEPESLHGNPAPCRKARENDASTTETGFRMRGFGDYEQDETTGAMKQRDYKDATDLVVHSTQDPCISENLALALGCNNGGESVVFPINDKATRHAGITGKGSGNGIGIGNNGDPCPTLTGGDKHAVAFQQNTRDEIRLIGGDGNIAGALAAQPGMKQQNYIADNSMTVRRLTPEENEKLQGFEPGYTKIPYRGKPAEQCPDGPRYKALGNSMAVPCMFWIGKRIQEIIND